MLSILIFTLSLLCPSLYNIFFAKQARLYALNLQLYSTNELIYCVIPNID